MTRSLGPELPTPREVASYRSWSTDLIWSRFCRGVPFAVALAVSIAASTRAEGATPLGVAPSVAALMVGALLVAVVPLRRVPALRARPGLVMIVVASAAAVGAALVAIADGGFTSVVGGLLLVIWGFASALLPLPVRVMLPLGGITLALFSGLVTLYAGAEGLALFSGLAASGLLLTLRGAASREEADRTAFVLTHRLEHLQRALADRNAGLVAAAEDLSKRVRLQVDDIVDHARSTAELEEILATRVAARSRHLAARVEGGRRVVDA